jgi:hypothetical protein
MKIRVAYTYEISAEDLACLKRYNTDTLWTEPLDRHGIRALLKDLGEMGVDDQICAGRESLKAEAEREAHPDIYGV